MDDYEGSSFRTPGKPSGAAAPQPTPLQPEQTYSTSTFSLQASVPFQSEQPQAIPQPKEPPPGFQPAKLPQAKFYDAKGNEVQLEIDPFESNWRDIPSGIKVPWAITKFEETCKKVWNDKAFGQFVAGFAKIEEEEK